MFNSAFPSLRMRIVLFFYGLLAILLVPVFLLYLYKRGRKDKLYSAHLAERFGALPAVKPGAIWIHAVSLGEFRSAVPLIRAFVDRGEHIHITHFTPAARREIARVFGGNASVTASYVPYELGIAYRRYFKRLKPKYGLVMEVEYWPRMIAASRKADVPLFLCNGQYPTRRFEKDGRGLGLRRELVTGFAGVMVKSELQAARFASLGVTAIEITGELRFDQPVPGAQLEAGALLRTELGARPVTTIASAVEGEDDLYLAAIAKLAAHPNGTLIVYVPRAPERFDEVHEMIKACGLCVARRTDVLDSALSARGKLDDVDVLLGDSLGEMYFYLSLAERVVVGGGFSPSKGAHNIIEPLALKKPVITGPEIWTIEYPAQEALTAGVLVIAHDANELLTLIDPDHPPHAGSEAIDRFFAAHAGATAKTLEAIPRLLAATSR